MIERCDPHPAFERISGCARPADWPETRYEKKSGSARAAVTAPALPPEARTDGGAAGLAGPWKNAIFPSE